VATTINIISKENVVILINVAFPIVRSLVVWVASLVKEAKQVTVLAMEVTEDLYFFLFYFNHCLLPLDDKLALSNELFDLFEV